MPRGGCRVAVELLLIHSLQLVTDACDAANHDRPTEDGLATHESMHRFKQWLDDEKDLTVLGTRNENRAPFSHRASA